MLSASAVIRAQLSVLQTVYQNSLTRESPVAPQPPHITVPLRMHQLAVLQEMHKKERSLQRGHPVSQTETFYADYGILGDKVGVGKTLMVLGHVSQMSLAEQAPAIMTLQPRSTYHCFSVHRTPLPEEDLYDTLIVVPHTLYRQWHDAITKQTSLQACFLKTQRDIDKDTLLESISGAHVTLVSNTLYPSLLHHLAARFQTLDRRGPLWMRIIYDEVDTIKIPQTCPKSPARFTWFVTATFEKLLFLQDCWQSYHFRSLPSEVIEQLHPDLQRMLQLFIDHHPHVTWNTIQSNGFFQDHLKCYHPSRAEVVIRCDSRFLDESIELPPLLRQTILCQSPASYRIVQNALPSEAEQALHAGDIQQALQILGVSSHSPMTLVEAATAYRQRELERVRRRLAFTQEEEYSTPQAKEQAIQTLQSKILSLETQIQSIQERLESLTDDKCSICLDASVNPVITPCCSKRFCGECILQWMTRATRCPLCRESFHPNQLVSLSSTASTTSLTLSTTERKPKKIEALLKLLQDNPEGTFLVFSRYENPFATQEAEAFLGTTPVGVLQGNKDVIASLLTRFARKQIRVLFLSSRHAAAGLNIPTASHVVLLHKMIPDEERQILGRAYRLGREGPLHFIHLLHESE